MSLTRFALQKIALPAHVVRVLTRDRRQLGSGSCLIKHSQLVHQDRERPEIDDDVMRRQQQDIVAARAREQMHFK